MLTYVAIVILVILVLFGLYFGYESFTTGDRIILYHASWCGYCKQLLPIWNEFENKLKIRNQNLKVDKILCDNNGQCKSINGFPTIIYIKNGKKYTFNKERTLNNLIKFVDQPDL